MYLVMCSVEMTLTKRQGVCSHRVPFFLRKLLTWIGLLFSSRAVKPPLSSVTLSSTVDTALPVVISISSSWQHYQDQHLIQLNIQQLSVWQLSMRWMDLYDMVLVTPVPQLLYFLFCPCKTSPKTIISSRIRPLRARIIRNHHSS